MPLVASGEILNVNSKMNTKKILKEDDNILVRRETEDTIYRAFVCEITVT